MRDDLSYEELSGQHLSDLPLPDEEQSWQKMKLMLDEEDKRRLPPLLWIKSCAGWGFFLIVVPVALWLLLRTDKWNDRKDNLTAPQITEHKNNDSLKRDHPANGKGNTTMEIPSALKKDSLRSMATTSIATAIKRKASASNKNAGSATPGSFLTTDHLPTGAPSSSTGKNKRKITSKKRKKDTVQTGKQESPFASTDINLLTNKKSSFDRQVTIQHPDTANKGIHKKDAKKQSDTSAVPTEDPPKAKDKEKKKFYFSAGIGEQQQIPLKGQKAVPYNYYGRKGSLADYVPSIYLRLERDKNWFLQSEFRYGAPQSVKELSYSQFTISDSSGNITRSTSMSVKKTFYHQIPVSFNYYLLPRWSAGAGFLYSRFYGAITEEVVKQRNNLTQTETVLSKKIIKVPASTDSFFTRSQMQLLLQTEYQWKRVSIGMRYTLGLQPYIKYTDPGGQAKQEKNRSLQAYIRFELLNSRKK